MMDEIELRNSYGHGCLTNIKNCKKQNLKSAGYSRYLNCLEMNENVNKWKVVTEWSIIKKGKAKVIPLQARCGPEGGYRYSSTLPWPRH